MDLFQKLFGKESSKNVAKERLRLVLVHDRATVAPERFEALKEDLIRTVSSYVEIDREGMEINLSQRNDSMAIVASIPVKAVKRFSR